MLCTARTPLIPSASAPFVVDCASCAAMKASRARGSQISRTTKSTGITESVSRPSCQSSQTITPTMPKRSAMSPTESTEVSRNSCIEFTSPCSRDISRPTSVLSMNESDTRCRCPNIARRMSESTFSAARPTTVSCTQLAA